MERITIKWNKDLMFFEAFMPDGTKLPSCLQITLCDNFGQDLDGKKMPITAKIEAFVNLEV